MQSLKRFSQILIVVLLASVVGASLSFAGEVQVLNRREVVDGDKSYQLVELYNKAGSYEVHVYLKEIRRFAPDTLRLVLVGKSIIVPGKIIESLPESEQAQPKRISHWFIIRSLETIRPIFSLQTEEDPWPTARTVIQAKLRTQNDWYAWLVLERIAGSITISNSKAQAFQKQIIQEQLNLADLEVRVEHMAQNNPKNPLIPEFRDYIIQSWQDIDARISTTLNKKIWLWAVGDTVAFYAGVKVVSLLGKGISAAAASIGASSFGKSAGTVVQNFKTQIGTRIQSARTLSGKSATRSRVGAVGYAAMAKLTVHQKVAYAVSFLENRSIIARQAFKAVGALNQIVRAGYTESKYVALAGGFQLGSEIIAAWDDAYDPNPLYMARNISTDKDLVTNVGYVVNETFWMSGVFHYLGQASRTRQILACGLVAVANSTFMNVFVKGDVAPEDIIASTAWSSGPGAALTNIDLTVKNYFAELATSTTNPKLEFVGYALVVVSQSVGAAGYTATTEYVPSTIRSFFTSEKEEFDPNKPPEVMIEAPVLKMVPVFAPHESADQINASLRVQ